MKPKPHKIAFYGSSLLSAYWNGAATYYRGIIKALHQFGYETTFFEPDAFERQQHKDMEEPEWAKVIVYKATETDVRNVLAQAKNFDIVVKASGVGVFDDLLEIEVLELRQSGQQVIFWDVDAPATLGSLKENPSLPFKKLIPEYDMILTYGGGAPIVNAYKALGAKKCIPVYNALDPDTHHPVKKNAAFACDLAFLGNRLPDREARVEEFLFKPTRALPHKQFILGGNGWEQRTDLPNVKMLGHVFTKDHNAFNSSPKAVLNINRESMAQNGFSPATRVFEAAGAGACIITDAFKGAELFLEPGKEILIAHNGEEVIQIMKTLTDAEAKKIGEAALERMLTEHTYYHRVKKLAKIFEEELTSTTYST